MYTIMIIWMLVLCARAGSGNAGIDECMCTCMCLNSAGVCELAKYPSNVNFVDSVLIA